MLRAIDGFVLPVDRAALSIVNNHAQLRDKRLTVSERHRLLMVARSVDDDANERSSNGANLSIARNIRTKRHRQSRGTTVYFFYRY